MICRLVFLVLLLPVVPLPAAAPPVARRTTSGPLHREIDRILEASPGFARYKAPAAFDAEFLRRVTLDLTGCIPTTAEARAFLADRSPNKREALVDRLLNSPEHARHLATFLDVTLMERLPGRQIPQAEWFEFLRRSVLTNQPWDVLAREILSGDGQDPAARHRVKFFLERNGEPNLITRDISRLFLGTNLQCAQCHDHPRIEEYRQDDYYGLLAFIGRTSIVSDRKKKLPLLAEKADGETTYQSVFDPRKVTKTALPRVPGGQALRDPMLDKSRLYVVAPAAGVASVPAYSRRAKLAAALTQPGYLPFRRNIANRLWALMMGRGLVEPLDMDHPANPPSHPELLDLLADDIGARRFNMREFLREIALSQAYQRSSEPPPGVDLKDAPLYATAVLKPLTPEQLALSLMQASGYTDAMRASLGKSITEEKLYARLTGGIAPFVRSFGSGEGAPQGFDARIDQALFLANGSLVRSWLTPGSVNLLGRLQKLSGDALADELYLSIFTRLPSTEERQEVADFLTRHPGRLSDLAWALLASTEFRFNH
ncbi:MAG: DUF1549 domain-containing protein [Gemmataceae bacterium]